MMGSATTQTGWEALRWATGVSDETARRAWNEAVVELGSTNGRNQPSLIPRNNDGSDELVRTVYALTRLLRPPKVLEIGVGRGATSRAILAALHENGDGHLWSVEFPPLRAGYAHDVGCLVEPELRGKWSLLFAPSAQVIPRVLADGGPPRLFVHDGAHSYYIQRSDLQAVARVMNPGDVIVVDDVNNDAFLEVADAHGLEWSSVAQHKQHVLGLARRPLPGRI
jgi:predicted O-methyltransferase YrrM